jgi:hypothetical protein
MYDLDFIYNACGLTDLPPYIDRHRLFNVSLEPATGDVKLYVLDKSERFLYKISSDGISLQYAGDDVDHGADLRILERHLRCQIDPRQIVIDAVEEDIYYVYLDDAETKQSVCFVEAICQVYGVTEVCFLEAMNAINKRQFTSVSDGLSKSAVSLVKVPLRATNPKIYSRPFHSGNGFDLDSKTTAFLSRLCSCDETALSPQLKHMWVATELLSDRMLIVTQDHGLLHKT